MDTNVFKSYLKLKFKSAIKYHKARRLVSEPLLKLLTSDIPEPLFKDLDRLLL